MNRYRLAVSLSAVALALMLGSVQSFAQVKFPVRPLRVLIPFAAGGGTDVVARIVGQRLGEQIGQPVLIEPRPGAGGAIAVADLMRSEPDGHSLLLTTSSHATLPALNKLGWHPGDDFVPIAAVYSYPFLLVTNAANAARFRNLGEMLAFARANPGKLNWGSSGSGGPQHLTGLQFIKLTQLSMVHVPYRGNGPMIAALNSNEIQVAFDTQTLVVPQIEAGRLVPLALASDRRAARLPQVPTFREAGIDLAIQITNFVLAPKGLPAPIQAVLNREFAAALADPSVRARLEALGHTVPLPAENTPQAVRQHIDMFQSTYSALIIEMGIKAE